MAGTGVMSLISSSAAKGSSDTQQKSRAESSKTSQSVQEEIDKAKQKVEQIAKEKATEAYKISIPKGEPAASRPAMPGLSQPLREYMRLQNS